MLRNLNVVSSSMAPKDRTALWLKRENNSGSLYYNDGIEWKPLTSAGGGESSSYDIIYTDGSDESKAANMVILEKLGTTNSAPVLVDNKNGRKVIGNFYNGTITTLVDDSLHVIDISFDTGDITTMTDVDISKIEEYTHLEIGDSAEVKSFNLEQLKTGPQMVSIDYGFGVANWNSSTGGEAHITTAQGVEVYYTIGIDGTVTKSDEIGKDGVWRKLTDKQNALFTNIVSNKIKQLNDTQIETLSSFPRYFWYLADGLGVVNFIIDTISLQIMSLPIQYDNELFSLIINLKENGGVISMSTDTKFYRILEQTRPFEDAGSIKIIEGATYNGNVSISSLTITEPDDSLFIKDGCNVFFKTGTTAPTITLPTVKWANNDVPSFKANKAYELNFKTVNFVDTTTLIGAYAEYTV